MWFVCVPCVSFCFGSVCGMYCVKCTHVRERHTWNSSVYRWCVDSSLWTSQCVTSDAEGIFACKCSVERTRNDLSLQTEHSLCFSRENVGRPATTIPTRARPLKQRHLGDLSRNMLQSTSGRIFGYCTRLPTLQPFHASKLVRSSAVLEYVGYVVEYLRMVKESFPTLLQSPLSPARVL